MGLPTLLVYTVSATVCFTLGILLLCVRCPLTNGSFRQIKRFQAYEAFLDLLIDMMSIACYIYGINMFYLNRFIVPFIFYWQIILESLVLLRLMHSYAINKKIISIISIPILLIFFVHVFVYLSQYGKDVLSMDNYITYLSLPISGYLGKMLYVILVLVMLYCFYWFVRSSINFRKELNGIYSGEKVLNGNKLFYIVYAFIIFLIFATVDTLIDSPVYDFCFMIANNIVYIFCVICIINSETIYGETALVEQYKSMALAKTRGKKSIEDITLIEEKRDEDNLISLISTWERDKAKPYLRDDISIVSVADEIGIVPRQLSWYLNSVKKINFNIWINRFKIDEVKRLIESDKNLAIKDITYKVGFSSPERLSKIFKGVTGMTATEYKNSIAKELTTKNE
jgi:AraC-like DNA-binding protein